MSWEAYKGVVLRGSTVNDPEDDEAAGFIEAKLALLSASAVPQPLASGVEADGDGVIVTAATALRETIELECIPAYKSVVQAERAGVMNIGQWRKAVHCLSLPYTWIYDVLDSLAGGGTYNVHATWNRDYDAGSYDAEDDLTWEFADWFWRHDASQGSTPMAVRWDRESLWEYAGSGLYEWRPKLLKLSIDTVV